jgi:GMP synthase-like glutamine amidotransferase
VYSNHPKVKIFGSCFGHQVISQALLGDHSTCVGESPRGWELGVYPVTLNPNFASQFACQLPSTSEKHRLNIQFSHGENVFTSRNSLPPGWMVIGESELCDNQGFFEKGRVLTYQGHPEFDGFVNGEVAKLIAIENRWSVEKLEEYLKAVDKSDDSDVWGDIAVEFLLQ